MKSIDDFLGSGHSFSPDESLLRFRFHMLNSILTISIVFSLLTVLFSVTEIHPLGARYAWVLSIYSLLLLVSLTLLRLHKRYYLLALNILVIGALANFSLALIIVLQDPFRPVWFHIVALSGFVLGGKKYGTWLSIICLSILLALNYTMDLQLSPYIIYTFLTSFFILFSLAYFFMNKIEKDAIEFNRLNQKLKQKVQTETKQRQEQEQMLLQQCRLASMGEMLDSIAHQWRQPLMNINAVLMNMDRAIETRREPQIYLGQKMDEVITLTTHMSQTIEDFRSLFRKSKDKEDFSIDTALKTALQIFDHTLGDIKISIACTDSTIQGYINEFVQVFIILIGNAIEALKDKERADKKIHIRTVERENHILLYIEDNAGGIRQRDMEYIFDPYYTTKEKTGGTGLGLYIAKIIIEQNMNGVIKASNGAAGAKFIIKLRRNNA